MSTCARHVRDRCRVLELQTIPPLERNERWQNRWKGHGLQQYIQVKQCSNIPVERGRSQCSIRLPREDTHKDSSHHRGIRVSELM